MLRNPIHITGVLRHCWLWATSVSADTFYPNPNFNPASALKTSIYCVHGTADRCNSFSLVADRLRGKLPDNIDGIHLLAFDHRMSGAAVEVFSKQLKDKIKANNDEHVIIMGHSRGALIASWFAEYLSAENNINVEAVVSICGPFRGSYLAARPMTTLSTSVDQMVVDSEFLVDLSQKIKSSSSKYLYVGAMNDYLVLHDSWRPYSHEHEEGNSLYLDRHGHLSIMSSHRLVSWLSERFQAPVAQVVNDDDNNALVVLRNN